MAYYGNGKKFVRKVFVKRSIEGFVKEGESYKYDELSKKFPFLDLSNKEYFSENFDNEFKVGDEVYFDKKCCLGDASAIYVVKEVYNNVRGEYLYTSYDVYKKEDKRKQVITVGESHLHKNVKKYIVSMGCDRVYANTEKPAIHEISERKVNAAIKNTWKEYFVFDNRNDAEVFAASLAVFLESYHNDEKRMV